MIGVNMDAQDVKRQGSHWTRTALGDPSSRQKTRVRRRRDVTELLLNAFSFLYLYTNTLLPHPSTPPPDSTTILDNCICST